MEGVCTEVDGAGTEVDGAGTRAGLGVFLGGAKSGLACCTMAAPRVARVPMFDAR